jgi:hypothetical protein
MYFLLLLVAAGIIFLPRVFYRLTWTVCEGQYIGGVMQVSVRRSKVIYPLIEYYTSEYRVRFIAAQYLRDFMEMNQKVTILHSDLHPEDAYVLDYFGLWGTGIVYFGVVVLFLTPLTFAGALFPKIFLIKLNADKGVIIKKL